MALERSAHTTQSALFGSALRLKYQCLDLLERIIQFKILHKPEHISLNNFIFKHSGAKIVTWIVEVK